MKPIENWQKGKIFAIANQLGMVGRSSDRDDDLHLYVEAQTGKTSVKELTFSEAAAVIKELKARQSGQAAPQTHQKAPAKEKPGGITVAQQRKAWALIGQLEKYDKVPGQNGNHRQRLCGIIKKELGMDASPADPFAWLTMKQGIKLIDAIARYAEHEERKALREGRVVQSG